MLCHDNLKNKKKIRIIMKNGKVIILIIQNAMVTFKIDSFQFYYPSVVPQFENCCFLGKIGKVTISIMLNTMVIFETDEFDICHFY